MNKNKKILYAQDLIVFHKHRITLSGFIKKTLRDEKGRCGLNRIWNEKGMTFDKPKTVDLALFLKVSKECLKQYKLKGLFMIVLHLLRKATRSFTHLCQKLTNIK